MKITSKCPAEILKTAIDPVCMRANCELNSLKDSLIGLDIMSYGATYVDKGFVDGYYEGEFSIFPIKEAKEASESLYFLLGKWESMAAIPCLNC